MLLELYFTFLNLVLTYGDYQAMLVIAFLCSLMVFSAAVVARMLLKNVQPWFFSAFIATEFYFVLAQVLLAFWYSSEVPALAFFEPATYVYLLFVVPSIMIYRKVMDRWPVLPWHVVVYSVSLLASLVFWYFMVFVFSIFVLV